MRINGESIKDIVYNTEKRYSSYIAYLEKDSEVAGKNKELFLDFAKSCIGQGITKQRIMIYLRWLRVLGQKLARFLTSP